MCTLKQNTVERPDAIVRYSPRPHAGAGLPTMTCAECGTSHYQRQLSCRKCGAYFLPTERPVSLLNPRTIAAGAGALIGLIGMLAGRFI
jgi:hypothetical protein